MGKMGSERLDLVRLLRLLDGQRRKLRELFCQLWRECCAGGGRRGRRGGRGGDGRGGRGGRGGGGGHRGGADGAGGRGGKGGRGGGGGERCRPLSHEMAHALCQRGDCLFNPLGC